jgi:hypothetical protein
MNNLTFIIPIMWVIVATAAGLILYKSSTAVFVGQNRSPDGTKRLRLAGSACIAALVFYGLKWSTPEDALHPATTSQLQELSDMLQHARNQVDQLFACTKIAPPVECKTEIESLRGTIVGSEEQIKKMVP